MNPADARPWLRVRHKKWPVGVVAKIIFLSETRFELKVTPEHPEDCSEPGAVQYTNAGYLEDLKNFEVLP